MEQLEYKQETQTSGVREFLTVVFKHKKKIVGVFLGITVTVTLASLLLTPVYEAKSTFLVKIGREYMNRTELANEKAAPPVWNLSQEEVANSEIQILTNRDLIEKVLTTLKVEKVYPDLAKDPGDNPMESAIRRFSENLDALAIKKSNVIQVSFQHNDPRIAASAVNLLVEYFKEKHLQVFSDPRSGFLDMQRSAYEQKLQESASSLQSFKQQAGVYSLEEQRTLLLKQRVDLDTALKNSLNTIQELNQRVAALKQQIQAIGDSKTYYTSTSEMDAILVQSKAKLLDLQLQEQELLRKYTAENRLVTKIRQEIKLARDFIKEQETDIGGKVKTGNVVYQDAKIQLVKAEAELNAQKGKSSVLRQQVAQLDGEIRALDSSERTNQQLKREHAINEKNYQTYVEKTEEARITEDMNRLKMANISIIQPATVPVEPVKPKTTLNIILGIMLGLISGFGIAFLSESTSQGFSTPDRIEKRIGLPVLATIAVKEG